MSDEQERASCPFQWGDRVDHKKFGLGTVVSEPISGGKDWRLQVEWDDPSRGTTGIMSSILSLVSRPDAKGGAYWSYQYNQLLASVHAARNATNEALSNAFRPRGGEGLKSLLDILEIEKSAVRELTDFLERDEAGEHP